jgi:integrase
LFSAQIIAKTGMKPWSLHDLRRTVATRLSELGAPPHVVEKLLGHHMAGVMARYNLHDYLDDQRHWLAVWQDHLEAGWSASGLIPTLSSQASRSESLHL